MAKYYTLDKDKNVVPGDMLSLEHILSSTKNVVKRTNVTKDITISTVFLGIDHNFSQEGPPVVFETMVFGGEQDELCERYSTWKEAVYGHNHMVERMKDLLFSIKVKVSRFDLIDLD
jgi:hypothetical protein